MLKIIPVPVYIIAASLLAGCFNDAMLKANQQQLERQQSELNQLKQEVATLQTQRPANNYPSLPPGSCDTNIMREATRKGGERFAASDFSAALGYYQDALTACPNSAQANVNLARVYEAVGDRAQAVAHYRTAANASGADADAEAARDARAALSRLGG
jgi:tetratricopeptide (TPR) repeat protein